MKADNFKTASAELAAVEQDVRYLENVRKGMSDRGLAEDASLSDLIMGKYNLSMGDFLTKVGVETNRDTINNLLTVPNQGVKWLVPELIRDAITLGIRQAPIYPTLIASEQSVNALTVIMPQVNMSDAAPAKVNEGETIPLGTVSFGQKQVTLFKLGKGLKLTDELKNYVSMDVLSIFLRDFGIKLGYAQDVLAIDCLINGDKNDGSESAPVVGVLNTGSIEYKDLLRIWVRAGRMGRNFSTLVADEETAINTLALPQYSNWSVLPNYRTQQPIHRMNLRTPIPQSSDFLIHGNVPDGDILLVDKSSAMIKLNSQALMVESERIVSNQTEAVYASLTTGFAKVYRDAAIILDSSMQFNGFPPYMEIDPLKNVGIEL